MQIIVNNLLTNYHVFGEGNKETLLILHGWRSNSRHWFTVAEALSTSHRVILLDNPGMGSSQLPEKAFDTYDYANFVKSFLKKLNIEETSILGHSFGGRLGIILCSDKVLSKNIGRLILVDSAGIEKQRFIIKLLTGLFKRIKSILPDSINRKIISLVGSADYQDSGNLRETFVKVVNQDLEHLLNDIEVETLIVWGDRDDVLSVEMTKTFKKEIKNSKVRIVWGAKHAPHLEKTEEFVAILKEFLNVE